MHPVVISPVKQRRRIRAVQAPPKKNQAVAARAGALNGMRSVVLTVLPLIVADVVAVVVSFAVAAQTTQMLWSDAELRWTEVAGAMIIGCLLANLAVGLYPGIGVSQISEVRHASCAATILCPLYLLTSLLLPTTAMPLQFAILLTCCLVAILLPIARGGVRTLFSRYRWWGQPALVVGGGSMAASVFRHLRHNPRLGLRPVGILGGWDDLGHRERPNAEPVHRAGTRHYLGPFSRGEHLLVELGHPWLIVAAPDRLRSSVGDWGASGRYPTMVSYVAGSPTLWRRASSCLDWPGTYEGENLDRMPVVAKAIKRLIDLSFTLIGGILLLPLILLLAALIKLSSPGPIIYRQWRVGYRGRQFVCWKFRTMVCDGDRVLADYLSHDPAAREFWNRDHKLRHDPRVTRVGHLLRKTSLDELPQLWNVLRGDMSLVGPRPILPAEIPDFGNSFKAFCSVQPGITGLWQVSGRNHTTYSEHVEMDRFYAENYSLWLDIYILLLTFRVVLFRHGAY